MATAIALLLLEVDPISTWFYVFAWYPTLILLDAIATRMDGRPRIIPSRAFISLLVWSPVIWLVFEAANFRLENWYYVNLPRPVIERWSGILLSFATVVPAIVLAERMLDAIGLFRHIVGKPRAMENRRLTACVFIGAAMAILALGFPRVFFPLIWGAAVLVVDPFVYRREKRLSLLADIERGAWGRIGRLMVGGLGIGLVWETYNYWARGKWIYTVPWLDEVKLFEMPPFGFVGFPVFALGAWAMYAALCVLGIAMPVTGRATFNSGRLWVGSLLATVFAVSVLFVMERRTISSTTSIIAELPAVSDRTRETLEIAGIRSTFALAMLEPDSVVTLGIAEADARASLHAARLATLRGIGSRHTQLLWRFNVRSVCDLARRDPETLFNALAPRQPDYRPRLAEVRLWVRAATNECASS